jgi:hypothetical protein
MDGTYIKTFHRKILTERPHGRPRHRWDDKIKLDFREEECGDVIWIQLTPDRVQWWFL